jgi:flagellar biosynthetic protein FliQ
LGSILSYICSIILSMSDEEILETARQAILIAIQIGAPILLIGLVVGVAIALVQALTQIQEITLVFVPKILAIFVALFMFLPTMMKTLTVFMETLADRIIGMG